MAQQLKPFFICPTLYTKTGVGLDHEKVMTLILHRFNLKWPCTTGSAAILMMVFPPLPPLVPTLCVHCRSVKDQQVRGSAKNLFLQQVAGSKSQIENQRMPFN
jgi:hypothetical protein